MKKILLTGLIAVMAVFCTGCVQFSYDISINDKDKISISEVKRVNYSPFTIKPFRNALKSEFDNFVAKNQGYKGYKVKGDVDYYGNGTMTLSREGLSFLDASQNLPKGFKNADGNAFVVNRSLLKRNYKIHLFYNMSEAMQEASSDVGNFQNSSKVFEKYKSSLSNVVVSVDKMNGMSLVKVTYADGNSIVRQPSPADFMNTERPVAKADLTIKIPVKATSHNAHKVISDTEYQWDLSGENMTVEILLEYEKFDFSILAMIFSMFVVVIAVIALSRKLNGGGPVKGL